MCRLKGRTSIQRLSEKSGLASGGLAELLSGLEDRKVTR